MIKEVVTGAPVVAAVAAVRRLSHPHRMLTLHYEHFFDRLKYAYVADVTKSEATTAGHCVAQTRSHCNFFAGIPLCCSPDSYTG